MRGDFLTVPQAKKRHLAVAARRRNIRRPKCRDRTGGHAREMIAEKRCPSILQEFSELNKDRSELANLARAFYRDHKKVLGLIKEENSGSGFETVVHRLFGNSPTREKVVKLGFSEHIFCDLAKSQATFLPARWRQELDKTSNTWRGCENWWAGYPLISLVELRAGDHGAKGYLRLNAEVGPVLDHRVRARIIEAISTAASSKGLERIQFRPDASDKGRLYSRFLRRNSVALNDISDPDEIERKFVQLINDFDPEFKLVAGAMAQFLRPDDTP